MHPTRPLFRSRPARLASILMGAVSIVAMLVVTNVAPVSPRLAYADHNSMYSVCPDPISEGNTGRMGIRRSGHKIKKATFFTDHRYHTADFSDYEAYHGVTIESKSSGGDTTLWAPIVTKEDSLPEHDETFAMGYWDGGVWHHCVVTIADDDAPEILNVDIISSPVDRYAYRASESIDVAVELDKKVDVAGGSTLALFLGDGNGSTWRGATYHSGSGTRSLVFRYRVQPEDFDPDGIKVGAAAVADDRSPANGFSGGIFSEGTDVPIDYSHGGVTGDWRQKVDGRPYVQSIRMNSAPPDGWGAYRANQTIEVSFTFDTEVVVGGDVSVGLHLGLDNYDWDGVERRASYLRGSGTDTLVFGYTVRPGDMDHKGVGVILGKEDAGFGGSGTIKAKGTDVERNPWYLGTGNQPDHKVDTAPPAISSLGVTSRPANGEAYAPGETITVDVAFSERVTPSGDLRLELDVGGKARHAALRSLPERTFSSSLVFDYTVQDGDVDVDGIGIGANRLSLNGGGIHDIAGNTAGLSHVAVIADPGHKVAG